MKTIISLILISFSLTSFISPDSNYFLLDESDFQFMRLDNKEPALSIPEENFKSYNQWQCFETQDVEVLLVDIDYNKWHQVPSIAVGTMAFDIDPDINWDKDKVLDHWNNLIQGSKSICIFAAFLQNNDNNSLWYIQKIKTQNGYWDRAEYGQFLAEQTF